MGVLNITPDSFFDGGRYFSIEAAVERALQMVEEGADFIDIGGESTRPFAQAVSLSEEAKRVLPIIECLAKNTTVPISIDTRHPEIMQSAIEAGASIVNDIYALQAPGALEIIARKKVTVCLMHMQGLPKTMQEAPYYHDVVKEIFDFLAQRIIVCEKAGIAKNRIWIDPGFGFGKTLKHNLTLLGRLSIFKALECSILAGLSRKSMFKMLLDLPVEERLFASLAAAVLAAQQGASIIRTHDVKPTWECLKVVEAVAPYWREECHQSVNILEQME